MVGRVRCGVLFHLYHPPKFEVVSVPMHFLPTAPSMSGLYGVDDFDANGNFISLLPGGEGIPPSYPHPSGELFYPVSSTGNGQFHPINRINWDDPSLYTMQLTRNEIETLTHNIPATNIQTDIPTLPELPPACTPSPQPSGTSSHDDGSRSPTEREVPDTSGEMPKSLREANCPPGQRGTQHEQLSALERHHLD